VSFFKTDLKSEQKNNKTAGVFSYLHKVKTKMTKGRVDIVSFLKADKISEIKRLNVEELKSTI
jgi:hypothetical protein